MVLTENHFGEFRFLDDPRAMALDHFGRFYRLPFTLWEWILVDNHCFRDIHKLYVNISVHNFKECYVIFSLFLRGILSVPPPLYEITLNSEYSMSWRAAYR